MFFQGRAVFLALVLVSFIGCPSVLASGSDVEEITDEIGAVNISDQPRALTLSRFNAKNRVLARYTDDIRVEGCTYSLNRTVDRDLSAQAYNYSKLGGYKSHVLVTSFDVCKNKSSDIVTEYEDWTTKTFSIVGVGAKGTKMPIDWMSVQSGLKDGIGHEVFHHRSTVGSGHSEPQFAADLGALWVKDSPSVVELFIPRSDDLKQVKKLMMCGIKLHGSFDACDNCLEGVLRGLRQTHQSGQTSISQAIKDKLGDKCTDIDADRFVLVYSAHCPYKDATYHGEDDNQYYDLDYTYESSPRRDIFAENYGVFADKDVLSHARSVSVKSSTIYGHIHFFSDRKALYQPSKKAFVYK